MTKKTLIAEFTSRVLHRVDLGLASAEDFALAVRLKVLSLEQTLELAKRFESHCLKLLDLLPSEAMSVLAESVDYHVRTAVANHAKTPTVVLERLVTDRTKTVRESAERRLGTSKEQLLAAEKRRAEEESRKAENLQALLRCRSLATLESCASKTPTREEREHCVRIVRQGMQVTAQRISAGGKVALQVRFSDVLMAPGRLGNVFDANVAGTFLDDALDAVRTGASWGPFEPKPDWCIADAVECLATSKQVLGTTAERSVLDAHESFMRQYVPDQVPAMMLLNEHFFLTLLEEREAWRARLQDIGSHKQEAALERHPDWITHMAPWWVGHLAKEGRVPDACIQHMNPDVLRTAVETVMQGT